MNRLKLAACAALWLLAAPAAWAAAPDTADAYAARWPISLPVGAGLVRLPLPADVLTRLQTADLRDLRVFNGAGQAVPVALDRSTASATADEAAPIALPTLPILAYAPTAATAGGDLSLRIEDGPGGRVVRVDSSAAPSAAAAPAPTSVLTGVLVDTRTQTARLRAIELDASWPAARPFTFEVQTSTDLRHWSSLGRVTVYRGADGAITAPAQVALQGESLKDRYLRVTWDSTAAPDAVKVPGVRLRPMAAIAPPARIAVPLALPEGSPADPKVLEWRLPFATPLAALDIRADGDTALVPVRVLGRQQREAPWAPVGSLVLFNLAQGAQTQHNPPLELGQAAWREWRVEADAATPGFTTAPRVTAWLAPAQLVVVASGAGPFTLAAGRADAPAVHLPLASLIPGHEPGAQARLPLATLDIATAANPLPALPTTAPAGQRDLRRWLLWAVLAGGVLLLGGMAWVLMRQLNPPADQPKV